MKNQVETVSWYTIKLVWFVWIDAEANQFQYSSPRTSLHLTGCGASWQHDVSKKVHAKAESCSRLWLCRSNWPHPPLSPVLASWYSCHGCGHCCRGGCSCC